MLHAFNVPYFDPYRNSVNPNGLVHPPVKSSQPTIADYKGNSGLSIAEFQKYKEKVANRTVLLQSSDGGHIALSGSTSSRYFSSGRKKIVRNVKSRLGSRWFSPGVLLTLTYDPAITQRGKAWSDYTEDWQRMIHALNVSCGRKGRGNLKFLWVVEEMPNCHYPHIHVFFPGLRYLATKERLSDLWALGFTNVKYLDNVNVASYICKYILKLQGWSDIGLTCIWKYTKRIYGYSKAYVLPYILTLEKSTTWVYKWATKSIESVKDMTTQYPDLVYLT
jgi:hypothetical protein